VSVTVNKTAWKFPALALDALVTYLTAQLDTDVTVSASPSTTDIATPSIGIRHAACNPYTSDAAIIAHIRTRTTITIRTAITAENNREARGIHDALVAEVMGCILVVDETTKENALHTELNAVAPTGVTFSEARWTGNMNAVDDDKSDLVTRIELETIISPTAEE